MTPSPIDLREVISSQIPGLALLQNICYAYITPAEAPAYRQERLNRSGSLYVEIRTAEVIATWNFGLKYWMSLVPPHSEWGRNCC